MTETDSASRPLEPGGTRSDALEEERDFCLRPCATSRRSDSAGDLDEADYRHVKGLLHGPGRRGPSPLEPGASSDTTPPPVAGDPGGSTGRSWAEGVASGVPGDSHGSGRQPRPWPPMRRRHAGAGAAVVADAAPGRQPACGGGGRGGLGGRRLLGHPASRARRSPGRPWDRQPQAQSLQQAQQAADRGDDLTAVKDYQKILEQRPQPDRGA